MSEVNITQDAYVVAKNVPADIDDVTKLNDVIFVEEFPVKQPIIVGVPGNETMLLICRCSDDAEELLPFKHPSGIVFDRYIKQQVLKWPTLSIDKTLIDKMKTCGDLEEFRKTLNKVQAQFHEGAKSLIRAPSKYQIDYSKHLVAKYQQKYGFVDKGGKPEGEEKVLHLTVTGVDELTWSLVEIVKNMEIIELKLNRGDVIYKENTVNLLASRQEARTFANEVHGFIEKIKDKEKEKVEIEVKDQISAPTCCREVQESRKKSCCALAPSKDFIIIYDETFDSLQNIKQDISRKLSISRRKLRSSLSTQMDTVIEDVNKIESSVTNSKNAPTVSEFNWAKDAKEVKSFSTKEGLQIQVYSANDLRTLPVDCILISSDDELKLSSGVGKVISKAAGAKFKHDCKGYIANVGSIPAGHLVDISAGDLQYDCIILAAVPPWSSYTPYTLERVEEAEQHVHSAILQGLFKAETRGMESVGIIGPLSDLPEGLSVNQCLRATMEYSRGIRDSATALKEIHFIDSDLSRLALLQVKLPTFINQGHDSNYSVDNFVKVRIRHSKSRRSSKRLSKGDEY